MISLKITNIFKEFFFTKDKNALIHISDIIKDKINPIVKKIIISLLKLMTTSPIPKTAAAKSVGIDIRKLNLAESNLEKPKYLAQLIVIPDLLVPGTRASACANPI
tara:strand:+ start:575 stop:892 length:318 start_codon:yes stop_codon:yes gene_type:complete